jgi:hypothetical protein
MEINRNQYFLIGLVLLFLGYQFRVIESFTLNEKTSKFIQDRVDNARAAAGEFQPASYQQPAPTPIRRTVQPPRWIGLAMISVGCVLVFHSLVMPKPSG